MICSVFLTVKVILKCFFAKINTIHANIQFTKELEQNNQLPFLDQC